MTPEEAEDLAARTLAAIKAEVVAYPMRTNVDPIADRERVASDLAGLRDCDLWNHPGHVARYSDGLRRTAALYGVTP